MSVISLNELKARFLTTDKPSRKDFDDLIDTLYASNATATPNGPAGGDLGGTYPNPVIAADAVTFAKMQNINTGVLLGRYNPSTGNVEEVNVGSGLAITGGALGVTGGGGGSGGSGTVAGAVSTFTSEPTILPGGDGDLALIQAPTTFGSTMPQLIRVVAVCSAPFANYAVNDEIPLEYFRDKTDPETPSFQIAAYVSAGQVTVKVKVEYGDIAGSVGIAVYDKNLTTGPGPADPTLIPFASGDGPENYFYVRVYMSRFEPGTGFGSLALFEPADQTMPAAAAVATFTHNYGTFPSFPTAVHMVCVIADAATGHAVGDAVPLQNAYETGFANPAFGVTLTGSAVLVRREATTIDIPHKTTGALTSITADANWQIRVRTARGVNLPSIAFPAITVQVANPVCAWSYGNLLYVILYNTSSSRSYLTRIDLTTNRVSLVREYNPYSLYGNVSMFRLTKSGVPTDCIFLCDTRGIHRIDMDDESETTLLSGDLRNYKVVDVDETGAGGYNRPDLLYVQGTYGSANTNNSQSPTRRDWTGGAYPAGAYSAASVKVNVDWSALAGIGGSDYPAYQALDQQARPILMLQYNPLKRRFYLVHNGSGYLNIFKLDPGQTAIDWWDASPDGTKLDFEKMIAIVGGGDTWTDTASEHMFVEYDGATGAEKAIVIVRRGNTSLTGSVCRIPWNE